MTSNVAEWFWVWYHLSSISTVYEATFSYYIIMALLQNFCDFGNFIFGYRPQNENTEITENLYFWDHKVQMHMSLFFDHYFSFLSGKTKINKNVLNFINLDGLEAFERQTPGTWLEIWVNYFEFDVIWRASQLFLKLHSHNLVLWRFCSISVISEFSYLGIALKTKTRKSRKFFIFGSIMFKCMRIYFLISISAFWVLKLK